MGEFFALKFSWYLCEANIRKNFRYSAFTDSVDTFRQRNFENRLKKDNFKDMASLKTCKIGHLLS